MTRPPARWSLLLAVLMVVLVSAGPANAQTRHPVVLLGTGGFTWSDLSAQRTPTLWGLLQRSAVSTVTVRSVDPNTCPIDAWLSLSAGERAAAPGPSGAVRRSPSTGCPPIPDPSGGMVPGWSQYAEAASRANFGAHLGLLADQLAAAGVDTVAAGPGAAVGAARSDGRVTAYVSVADLANGTARPSSGVTLVDLGAVRDPDDVGTGEQAPGSVEEQLRGVDARLASLLPRLPGTRSSSWRASPTPGQQRGCVRCWSAGRASGRDCSIRPPRASPG
ncbi:MAG: hypothetical protein IPH03_18830 [Tetrasphaera sp.]|nr:hypothetical protein [Tetrasphaera sp.]